MDIIPDLPNFYDYSTILVVVDGMGCLNRHILVLVLYRGLI